MSRILNEEGIIDVIWGATLLGGGGGGSMQSGLDLLTEYKKSNSQISVNLISADEMEPTKLAAVTAGMGAPKAIVGVDFTPYATNAFNALKDMAAKMTPPKNISYSMAVELGGFNTFVPMLISMFNGIPFIDADGAARAVPALDTLLLHVNGCATSPLAMADDKNNKLTIETSDKFDALMAEEIGRHICMAFQMKSGLSGWMVTQQELFDKLPLGTVSLSQQVGEVLRKCAETKEDVYSELEAKGIAKCRSLVKGKVTKAETVTKQGFDYGEVTVTDSEGTEYIIYFQNENLLITCDGKPLLTVPDIIGFYDADTGKPLTNADIFKDMNVHVGAIKVNDKWWQNSEMAKVWKPFLERVGYTGELIPF